MRTGRIAPLCASLLMMAVALVLIQSRAAFASPGPRYVDLAGICGGNSPCYTTIQAAVDAATAGDTITIYPGTYVENVSVDKDHLTIQSESGAPSTIVHAANSGEPALNIPAEHVLIHGFTVRNNATACDITFGGITIAGDHATVSGNTITGNCKGIVLHSSYVTVTANNISDNRAYPGSDGVYVWPNCTDITITGNDILNNSDEGIQQEIGGQNVKVANNTISNNGGTGVYLGNGGQDIAVEDNTISNNGGSGVYQRYGGRNIVIDGNDILDNSEDGIYLGTRASDLPDDWLEATLFWHDFRLEHNTIRSNDWDGIDLGTLLRHSWIRANTISENGENGIRFGGEDVTFYEFGQPVGTVASEWTRIERNNILTNTLCGIFCVDSKENWVGLNNFEGNGDNACSPVSDNYWHSDDVVAYTYDGNEFEDQLGNYWDDYADVVTEPVDVNPPNGIADDPYPIDEGSSVEFDRHPLMEHFESYFPQPPDVAFLTSSPDWLGQTTAFTNTTSAQGTVAYIWDFGDGETSTLEHPSHNYADTGFFTVTLTATNPAGSDAATQEVLVYGPPVADFTAHPTQGTAPLIVAFTDHTTTEPVPDLTLTYLWRFGDGGTSDLPNAVHTYESTGVYTITLTASNAAGSNTETKVSYVTVYEEHRVYLPTVLHTPP